MKGGYPVYWYFFNQIKSMVWDVFFFLRLLRSLRFLKEAFLPI